MLVKFHDLSYGNCGGGNEGGGGSLSIMLRQVLLDV